MSFVTLSVIIPTHNRASMLQRALRSVLGQSWQGNMEILVVSDGSTDDTEAVVLAFKDPRICLLKHEVSQGASAARNTGLRVCRGQYIAFLDDDDEWTPDKLETQLPVIESSSSEVGLVYAWMEYFHQGKSIAVNNPELRGDVFKEMLDKQALGGCPTLIIKREVLDKVKGFDEELPCLNDGDFIRRITKHYHVDYIPKILANIYVGHPDRISVQSRKNLLDGIKELRKRLDTFRDDYRNCYKAWSNILFAIGLSYIKAGMLRKGIVFLVRAFLKDPLNGRSCLFVPKVIINRLNNIFHNKVNTSKCDN